MLTLFNRYKIPELVLYILFSYPIFYFAYKFGSPDFGNIDFYNYYHLYKDWDFSKVASPFNTRIFSSWFIYLIYKSSFFYNSEIAFSNPLIEQRVFFSAVFFNWISAFLSAYAILILVNKYLQNRLYAFFIGLLFFLGFGIQFYCINTLTESFSILLFTVMLYFFFKRSYWIIPLLAVSVLQREYLFFIFGLMGLLYYFKDKTNRMYYINTLVASLLFFFVYIILRKTFFFTPEHANQLDFASYGQRFLTWQFPIGEYIRQSFLNQNLFLFYLMIIGYKWQNKIEFNKFNLLLITLLYLQAHFISVAAVLGNSAGRYFYVTTPLILLYVAIELKPLLQQYLNFKKNELLPEL